jgi:hypothetical protein
MMPSNQSANTNVIDRMGELQSRARAEYLEMPGLRLTAWQAARLWGVEIDISERLLANLVLSGFLWCNREGAYLRRSGR